MLLQKQLQINKKKIDNPQRRLPICDNIYSVTLIVTMQS